MKTSRCNCLQKDGPVLPTSVTSTVRHAFALSQLLILIATIAIVAATLLHLVGSVPDCDCAENLSGSKHMLTGAHSLMVAPSNLMGCLPLARHGSFIHGKTPRALSGTLVLPGAINLGSYASHADFIEFEQLWMRYWYSGISPPGGHPA